MAQSYSDYICMQSKRNPYLRNFCQFIANDRGKDDCKIVSLEFHVEDARPSRVDLDLAQFEAIMNEDSSDCQGRMTTVEDLSRAIIETLGSYLDIDPLFFASHIHGPKVDITSSKPSMAILPSKVASQNFLSLQYQLSVDFNACPMAPRKMSHNRNVPRKVVFLLPMKNTYIGLEQLCCSILLSTTRSSRGWVI